jgi:hypothetical protein
MLSSFVACFALYMEFETNHGGSFLRCTIIRTVDIPRHSIVEAAHASIPVTMSLVHLWPALLYRIN